MENTKIYIFGDMNFPTAKLDEINAGMKTDSTSVINKQINNLVDLMDEHMIV